MADEKTQEQTNTPTEESVEEAETKSTEDTNETEKPTGDSSEEVMQEEVIEEPAPVIEGSEDIADSKEKPSEVEFRSGDTVRVIYKIMEGDELRRTQPFEGIVISKKGEGVSKTFTVRRISANNVGVERIFPLFSPNIESITVLKRGKVRRSKLYYLRDKVGKAATRVKERA